MRIKWCDTSSYQHSIDHAMLFYVAYASHSYCSVWLTLAIYPYLRKMFDVRLRLAQLKKISSILNFVIRRLRVLKTVYLDHALVRAVLGSARQPIFDTIFLSHRGSTMARQTALVTGCSEGGIGFAIAAEFQARGVHVFATARSPSKVESLARLPHVTVLALDVTSHESISAAVAAVTNETGGTLNFLVNNAGYQAIMPMLDLDMGQAKQMFDVNVFGVIAVTKAFAPLVINAKGTIANLASIAGLMAPPYMGMYCITHSPLHTQGPCPSPFPLSSLHFMQFLSKI